jgi:hypothetical protein
MNAMYAIPYGMRCLVQRERDREREIESYGVSYIEKEITIIRNDIASKRYAVYVTGFRVFSGFRATFFRV